MKSLITLLTANTRERLNSKLFFSFVISWIVFNFKGIAYFIFANVLIAKKLDTISTEYINDFWSWSVPILFAIFYIVVLPYIQNYFDKWTKKANDIKIKAVRDKELSEKQHLIDIAEKNIELTEKQNEFSTVNKLNKRLTEQAIEINELKEKGKNLLESNSLKIERINELQEYIKQIDKKDISEEDRNIFINEYNELTKTEDFDHFIEIATLISKGESLQHIDHLTIERFKATKLIDHKETDNRKHFDFTKKGRVFWTQYVLTTRARNTKKTSYTVENEMDEVEFFKKNKLDQTIDEMEFDYSSNSESASNNLNQHITKILIDKLSNGQRKEIFNGIKESEKYFGRVFKDNIDVNRTIELFAMKNPQKFDEMLKKVDGNPFI